MGAFVDKDFVDEYMKKRKIKYSRFKKFTEWLENNDFDKLMYRLILEHNDDYIEKCHHNGFEAHPNRKLQFVIDYVIEHGNEVKIKELDVNFPNYIFEFKGYYFQVVMGQGALIQKYN